MGGRSGYVTVEGAARPWVKLMGRGARGGRTSLGDRARRAQRRQQSRGWWTFAWAAPRQHFLRELGGRERAPKEHRVPAAHAHTLPGDRAGLRLCPGPRHCHHAGTASN